MKKDQIFILKDRGVLLISGQDSKDFLQNLVTNDINKVTKTQSCFSSLLTPQGKYLFDFIANNFFLKIFCIYLRNTQIVTKLIVIF